jgi:hypothetical protein
MRARKESKVESTEDGSTDQGADEAAVTNKTAAASEPSSAAQRQQQRIEVDDSSVLAAYANFCRVASTPEELILDVGLNIDRSGRAAVKLSHRIILNHFTAKRLLAALSMALQQHEKSFGVLETDVRKRVRLVE